MAWYRTALWLMLLSAAYDRCCSSPSRFSRSLSLTRTIRSRVQQLLLRYKEEQFGNSHFDDKRIVLNTLPSVAINYRTWLQMEDTERLYRASHDLQTFSIHLESQRLRLQANSDQAGDMEMRKRNRRGRPYQSLSQSILGIELDLRDLMRQANSQLLSISTLKKMDDNTNTPPPTTRLTNPSSSISISPSGSALDRILSSTLRTTDVPSVTQPRQVQKQAPKPASSQWVSVLEGYVILRDLERYLSRLVRDYTLLQAKY
ncbi:uncharacterized protein LOC128512080 [Clarias gariepinus]|uniref:uncharacterized protein LOC128512080 n=1 Tax=Clarias gariepinus TaxID=13013 RepID=UPI00234CDDB6|nr:uncharacterized protein LOC128512080 [Clarias gariepinus]